jgi:hypothetical protein
MKMKPPKTNERIPWTVLAAKRTAIGGPFYNDFRTRLASFSFAYATPTVSMKWNVASSKT